jgi:hypothetical protein
VRQAGTAAGSTTDASKSLWPVVIGGALFFYLWRLAYMLYDLVFVWRHYARESALRGHLKDFEERRKAARAA